MSHRRVAAFRHVLLLLLMPCLFLSLQLGVFQVSSSKVPLPPDGAQAAPPPNGQPPANHSNLRKLINLQLDFLPKSLQGLPEATRITELQSLLGLSEYMIYGGHEKAHCDKLVQWMDKIFGQVPSLCQSIDGTISNQLQAKFQSKDFQVLFQRKYDFTDWKAEVQKSVHPADSFFVKEIETAEKATVLENARKVASIIDGEAEGDGHFLYLNSVIDLYLHYIPMGNLIDIPKDSGADTSKKHPPAGQPTVTVANLGKMFDDQVYEIAQGFRSFADEKERMFHLQTLLCLSEYMIYGGHEAANCDKLVQWMPEIFGQVSALCQSIDGQVSKDLHGKFQSEAYQVLFKQKFDFTELKDNLTAEPSVAKEIAIAEKATVLENAQRLASIISPWGKGYSLYAISVLYTYANILEAADKETRNDNTRDTFVDPSNVPLADIRKGNGTSKGGGLLALVQKHLKYSAAGGVVGTLTLGGIGIALWNYFKSSSTHQETTSWKNETLSLVTSHGEAKVDGPLLLAVICFLVSAGALWYFCASYCTAHGNVQQAENKEPKQTTKRQSEKKSKKSKKSIKSTKSSASTASMATSSPASGQTST